ncbi:uncharacterized protein LAJ45_04847 [Morchella importuna]|uniref:uncharacterized protein n=1 Tax=Morchella importuna TaxID=1174673 RepID=UPI001E8ED04D|nr:uncharacterized protein LAJ45_04847 [Morchella importuna]KAH8151145.1 hypothetical protein LAJ45_04847 [Morchella importuna]
MQLPMSSSRYVYQYLPLLCLLDLAFSIPAGTGTLTPPPSAYATHTIPVSGALTATASLAGPLPPGASAEPTQNTINAHPDLVPGQASNSSADASQSFDFLNVTDPQPIRGDMGSNDPGPHDSAYDRQNPDTLARPTTDEGDVQQAKWPMGLSSTRMTGAGWARQQNVDVLPAAKQMAGVDMRLGPDAYRELHWHSANEWAYVLNGSARISAIDAQGRNFNDDVSEGDLWYFPSGLPHSIQALENGVEFLLVFDDGAFSEDDTFLITEWFSHTPREVLAKNFGVPIKAFDEVPKEQLYIFNGTPPAVNVSADAVQSPEGTIPEPFSFHLSRQEPMVVPGGSVKVVDSGTFKASTSIAAAVVTIKPGAMREMHWHPNSDEWNFFISGRARITVFDAPQSARTFDYAAGDVGYILVDQGHYIENIGDEDVVLLEVLKAPQFEDVSLGQWMALTPPQVVKDTLHLDNDVLSGLSREKQYVVAAQP